MVIEISMPVTQGLGNFKYHWTNVISDTIGLLLFLLLCFLCHIDIIIAILYFSKILFLFFCVILLSQNVATFMCRILFVFATTVKITIFVNCLYD